MKKYNLVVAVLGFMISGIMPAAADSHKAHESTGIHAAKESLAAAQAMMTATNNRDLEAFKALLSTTHTPHFTFFWGEQVTGHEALAQWHMEWFQEEGWMIKSMDLVQGMETQNMAYLIFESKFDKSETRKFRLLVAVVMVREPGGWKIANSQQTLLEGPTS